MTKVPGWYKDQKKKYPEVFRSYESLGDACRKAGPIDDKTAALVKLAIAVGTRHEGAVHSHTRRSIEAGASIDECRHVVLLSLTTNGLPAMVAAPPWGQDGANDAAARPPQR